ncbi:hypothetical protein B0A55_06813 [Friedmanniomyces simplex]|uniref:Heterokaryon incompatibility domain-containing protein n=1 Tax=Friedmanniomyces simplex TaxID=329884 RepID=A0A4V5NFZ5_9PEZI|nr:hypothetical protein B0A55_06813 [Friedmanniomyces simplex]
MQSETPYRPLDVAARQIRLLSLKGAEHLDNPLVGDLVHASFLGSQFVEYETISYCWGDATVRSTLEIQGQTIDVPASSAQALRCVRQRDKSRLVWIDAICINQCDNPEKSTQVAMMADIYHSGTRNLIYLGCETDDSAGVDDALEYCHAVNGCVMRECEGSNDVHPSSSMADQRLRALSDFRTWVIQEAVLPAKSVIILGSYTLSLKKVLCVAGGWRNDGVIPPLLVPDYDKPVRSVHRDAARYLHQGPDVRLATLQDVQHTRQPTVFMEDLPSWVPSWAGSKEDLRHNGPYLRYGVHNAHGNTTVEVRPAMKEDLDVLELSGISLDTIVESGEVFQRTDFTVGGGDTVKVLHFVHRVVQLLKVNLETLDGWWELALFLLGGRSERNWGKDQTLRNVVGYQMPNHVCEKPPSF